MTMQPREQQALDEVAQRYRSQGYLVDLQPAPVQLENRSLHVDMTASKPGELRLVEIKIGRSRDDDAQRSALDTWVRTHAGAHLDVVVVGATSVPFPILAADELMVRLKRVESLLQEGDEESALLLAWAVFEAAARRRLYLDGEENAASAGIGVLNAVARQGLLDPDRVDRLRPLLAARNALSHGAFSKPSNIDPKGIEDLLSAIQEVLGASAA